MAYEKRIPENTKNAKKSAEFFPGNYRFSAKIGGFEQDECVSGSRCAC
jgi:hypothetical protein